MDDPDARPLNPAQQHVLEHLGAPRDERPVFPPELRAIVQGELDAALEPLAGLVDRSPLVVTKHALATVLDCEARHLAEAAEPFTWTTSTARGTLAHKAIELGVSWPGDPVPRQLVDAAFARLAGDDSHLGDWLRGISDAERAELTGFATDRVTVFQETFPPLQRAWRPTLESRVRLELAGGRIILAGKVDLAIGRAEGTRAGKVLVDFKTGRRQAHHLDDLRFYALLETAKTGVPPRALATHYLDEGRIVPEQVTEGLLRAALRRTVEGVARLVELASGDREPTRRAGAACRWCPANHDCDEGRRWLADQDG